jgi:hypothetical protein
MVAHSLRIVPDLTHKKKSDAMPNRWQLSQPRSGDIKYLFRSYGEVEYRP